MSEIKLELTVAQAIEYLAIYRGFNSYNSLAIYFTEHGYRLQAIQVSAYAKGKCKPRAKMVKAFKELFDIDIIDQFKSKGKQAT